MLPPTNPPMGNGDYPFDSDNFNSDAFLDYDQAKEAYDLIVAWDKNAEAGFSPEQWIEMFTHASNFVYDDSGKLIGFDFEWSSEDGEYQGKGHAHF